MAIRQARLERLALSASGHERMVKGPTAASKEQRIDFSAGIAWFGDILNLWSGRSSRLDPVRSLTIGGRCQAVASGGGSAHDLTLLVPAWGVERGTGEWWSVASSQ
jgi:hypothetical protein